MAKPSSSSADVSLKLLIDTKAERVLFGEADKSFVDFLINLLSLPLGTVTKLINYKQTTTGGSVWNIYKSVETMSDAYFQPNQNKHSILDTKFSTNSFTSTRFLPDIIEAPSTTRRNVYLCANTDSDSDSVSEECMFMVSDGPNATCPGCKKPMTGKGTYVTPPPAIRSGFVKGVVTYMVMDDLTVTPMSAISSITLLKMFNIKEVGALEEKVITFQANEGVKLLAASLHSKTVLTDVFLESILTTPKTSPTKKKRLL